MEALSGAAARRHITEPRAAAPQLAQQALRCVYFSEAVRIGFAAYMKPSQQVTQEQATAIGWGNLCQGAGAADACGSGTAGAFGVACADAIHECIMHGFAQADKACRMDVCIHCWCASACQ